MEPVKGKYNKESSDKSSVKIKKAIRIENGLQM